MKTLIIVSLVSLFALAACGPEVTPVEETSSTEAALRSREVDALIASGTGIRLLGVTSDDQAVFQQGSEIKVFDLRRRHATAETVTAAGAGKTAFAYISGRVAFIWTSPDYTSPSYGVSPLVIWSARTGAHEASARSPVGTLTTVASADGREIIFPANAQAGGTRGDIIWARTDLSRQHTLASDVQTDYSNGPCRPLAAFAGETQAIAYCEGTSALSTLAVIREGARREFTGLVNPPSLQVDAERGRVTTVRAGPTPQVGTPLMVTCGEVVELDPTTSSTSAFFSSDGSVLYLELEPDGSAAVRRAVVHAGSVVRSDVAVINALFAPGLQGSAFASYALSSPNARWFPFGVNVDPSVGTSDVQIADLLRPGHPSFVIDTATDNYAVSGKFFTADSSHFLYAKYNLTTGLTTLYAANMLTRQGHALTGPVAIASEFSVLGGDGVAFLENAQQGNVADPNSYTADVKTVGLALGATPHTVALGAWYTVLPALHESVLVYATDQGTSPGLHVARVAP